MVIIGSMGHIELQTHNFTKNFSLQNGLQIHPKAFCSHCYHSGHSNFLSGIQKWLYRPFSLQKVHFGHKPHFCTEFRPKLHFFQNFLSCSPKSGEQSYILSSAIWLLHAELQGPKVGTRHKTNSGRRPRGGSYSGRIITSCLHLRLD